MRSEDRPAGGLRADIDGLRAVAIVLVVAFHVGLAGFSGGFIGVDVFFVISGFLITRNLVAESERDGRPRLGQFWARRVRRLVPALGLMLVVVLALALAILPFVEWSAVASQARAAAFYVSNLLFARQSTDYFAPNIDTSLFLHTWSLGVEEQFYLLWPLLVLGVCVAARGRQRRRRAGLAAVFAVTFAGSLTLCLVQTASGSAYAFFGLPARAWEFAAAGLLALVPSPRRLLPDWVHLAEAVGGLAILAVATVELSQSSTYPGWRALLPVSATLLLIEAGTTRSVRVPAEVTPAGTPSAEPAPTGTATGTAPAGRANPVSATLSVGPLQWLGRTSYSWYLWHWPFILLAVQALGHDTLPIRATAALVALGVGALAHELVENPARFDPRLRRSARLTYTMGALVTVVALLASVGLDGAAADAATRGPGVALTAVRRSAHDTACAHQAHTSDGIAYCVGGDLHAHRTLLLVGDSHAWHWIPAFDQAARALGVRLLVRWQSICPPTPTPVITLQGVRSTACDRYHADTARLVAELRPTAVVTSSSDWYWQLLIVPASVKGESARAQLWGRTYQAYLASLRARGIRVGSVVDTPRNPSDPIDCLASHPADQCSTPRARALGPQEPVAAAFAAARARLGGVPTLDVNGDLCTATTCKVVANGNYVYLDTDHLYRGFVLTEVPKVEVFITQVMH